MQDATRVLAGDCEVRYESDGDEQTLRGAVVVLAKPDNTVLVHDDGGYKPAAWLTRADGLRYGRDADGFTLEAWSGDERLSVEGDPVGDAFYEVSPAGEPVGDCPRCGGTLVQDGARIVCTGCRDAYRLPRGADLLDRHCEDCGLPTVRVVRGPAVEVCADRDCDPLADAVAERVGWACPDCGAPLDVRRNRGLRAVCEPCGHAYPVPAGEHTGDCACGLPRVGGRCLDPDCDRDP
jgi:DNA topoisomerase-1